MFSDNGWPGIPDARNLERVNIRGTDLTFRLAPGLPAWILAEFAARFHECVESLDGPQLDDWSYAWRKVRGSQTSLSCHASGTAIDLNATRHPRGFRGTFTARNREALLGLLNKFKDPQTGSCALLWGGQFSAHSTVDEMHFQIKGDSALLARVKAKLTAEEDEVKQSDIDGIVSAVMDALAKQRVIANPGLDAKDPAGKDFTVLGILKNIETTQDQQGRILDHLVSRLKAK
jgi:hypothetical protein